MGNSKSRIIIKKLTSNSKCQTEIQIKTTIDAENQAETNKGDLYKNNQMQNGSVESAKI